MALPKDALRKQYQIRMPVEGRKSFIVTMPYEVVEREARRQGLKLEEFLEKYQVVAHYDNFEGVLYTFEEVPEETKKEEAQLA
jgi:hypothetical protein